MRTKKGITSNRKLQIAVLGSSKAICTKKAYDIAVDIGKEIAKRGYTTITGGGLGVMEAALKGAKEEGGLTVSILPEEHMECANKYTDVAIATGIGFTRDSINVYSADGCIIVGGGAGTLNEATFAYIHGTPTVTVSSTGQTAATLAKMQYLDIRKSMKIIVAKTAKEAVDKVIAAIEKKRSTDKNKVFPCSQG
ncbi:MAG: TIGR00725 family protein [Candidatus Woesearchaeota archaeon]|nr:MAG: TIGR00725 family protein [Candidatus Woesearchaeota archaeon]